MANDATNVVWVLGSGFSRSLGGPLLEELLQQSRFQLVKSVFPDDVPWQWLCDARWRPLVGHYADNLQHKDSVSWRNAEEYVEYLELAALGDQRARDVMVGLRARYSDVDFPELAASARNLIAAVTHEFVHRSPSSSERWQPYVRWAGKLQPTDHVITFNYDLVVERAFEMYFREKIGRSHTSPGSLLTVDGVLHKLHGSVDWEVSYEGDSWSVKEADDLFARIRDPSFVVGIGIPGPGKLIATMKAFNHQWICAQRALRAAHQIVFVGYRFPETDTFAKMTLLSAIQANQEPDLRIRVVLGPKRGDDVDRLVGMLKWALSGRVRREGVSIVSGHGLPHDLVHEPMWAEDFLTVFSRERL